MRLALPLALFGPLAAGNALAQSAYPNKPIRVVVPWPAGGVADIALRLIEPKLRAELGQPLMIDNKPGAGGVIGDDIVAKASPDGYTLLFTSSAVNMNIAIGKSMPYDLDRDLVPVVNVAWAPMVLVATPALNLKDAKDLIARAKANPGKMSYASAGNGSPSHLTVEMFRDKAGIDAVHVPYKGSPQALMDQIAGRVDFHFVNSATAIPIINSQKVTPLFVTTSKRLNIAPNIPTNAEAGFPDMQASQFEAFFAPHGTPQPILDKITAAVNKVLAMPDVIAAMAPYALEIDGTSSPQKFAAMIREDRSRWVKVAKDANIKSSD
ncbi:tripartite tricarboxylate transporter substrate binding protein [Aquabacterium sp.]|uniref:tripartite tricarboxylate transporter substrate binding protein n=1 Tax=Aquabacterium sp. TaxID=1872578 RepID=UPI001983A375|nr:tripartite tricarboxylate transporter substrate binding protein [Aquabacterium sp.]MBC7701057.1 tripartite tricarboxylate transporter substrate binding protein [Aquabacterium sp.]